jgi:acyl dehydratase
MINLTANRVFEQHSQGEEGSTNGRTVSEGDIVNFACITGDYNSVHVDAHITRSSPYGGRIAHGLLGAALAVGMLSRDIPWVAGHHWPGGCLEEIDIKYRDAILIGDTIKIDWKISAMNESPAGSGLGVITTDFRVVNQNGKAVYDGFIKTAYRDPLEEHSFNPINIGEVEDFWDDPGVKDPVLEKWFEDFQQGKGFITTGRTLTEADVTNFAALSGDYGERYVNHEFAKRSIYRGTVVHEMMVTSLAYGLMDRSTASLRGGETMDSILGGHLGDRMKFLAPVRVGDTIWCKRKLASKRLSRSKPDRGIIIHDLELMNQRGEIVQKGQIDSIVGVRG